MIVLVLPGVIMRSAMLKLRRFEMFIKHTCYRIFKRKHKVAFLFLLLLIGISVFKSLSKELETRTPDVKTFEQTAVLVLSARHDVERRRAIRQTWGKGYDNVFFIIGDKACEIPAGARTTPWSCHQERNATVNETEKHQDILKHEHQALGEEMRAHSDVIMVPMRDYYRSLPRKLKEAYRWALSHTTARWFLKIDDDAVVRLGQLRGLLSKYRGGSPLKVIGFVKRKTSVLSSGKWADPAYLATHLFYPKFLNGAHGHFVTRDVAEAVVKHDGFEYQGEDVSLGIWLNEMKIPVKWIHAPDHFTANGDCHDMNKIVIGHNISPAKMWECFTGNSASNIFQYYINLLLYNPENTPSVDSYIVPYQIERVNPLAMQLSKRFDIVVKTVFASFVVEPRPVPRFVEAMYDRHLEVWNHFKEPCTFVGEKGWFDTTKLCVKKTSAADFKRSFKITIESIRSNGFDGSISLAPLTPANYPLNGAHRIGATIALGLPSMPVQRVSQKQSYDWGVPFFQGKGMENKYVDFAMLEWTLRVPHMTTVIMWPQAFAMLTKLAKTREIVMSELGDILYEKTASLTRTGLTDLVFHAYGHQPWLAAKVSDLIGLETVLDIRVFFVLTPTFSVQRAKVAKEHVRAHYGIGKSSVHVSDSPHEAALIAEMVLNPNSLLYLNSHDGVACAVVAQEMAARLALTPVTPSLYLLPQTIMVDSGAVMAYFGLRPRTDVDVLFAGAVDRKLLGKNNGISVEPHTFSSTDLGQGTWAWGKRHWGQEHFVGPCNDVADLFHDPSNYGYCNGLKFVSLTQLARYKANRGEPRKDDDDVMMIQAFLASQPPSLPTVIVSGNQTTIKQRKTALFYVLSHSSRNKGGVSGLERRQGIRETWKQRVPDDSLFRFVLDSPDALLRAEADQYKDVLFLNTTQRGQAKDFGEKLRVLVRYSLEHYDFDAMLRIDDDNFLCVDHILTDLATVARSSDDFVWGWWFGPEPMLMNPSPATSGTNSEAAGRFCRAYSGEANAANSWRPDEMGMFVAGKLLRRLFDQGAEQWPVKQLMDMTLTQWLLRENVTYVVDNARFVRGQFTYGPTNMPDYGSKGDFCQHHISYHKAHPTVMRTLWERRQNDLDYTELRIHHDCQSKSTQTRATDAVLGGFEKIAGPAFAAKGLPLGLDGLFVIPAQVSHVVIDVGAYFKTEFADSLQTNSERLVIAFEPTPTTYESHQAKHQHPRLILLNAAAGPELAHMPFYVGAGAHCNSMLKRSSDFQSPRDAHGTDAVVDCPKKGKPVIVPVIPLGLVIARLPPYLAITDLKVDAQGYDFHVLRSVGRSPSTWARIKQVRCECQEVSTDEQALLLYENATQCPTIVAFMTEVGWKLQRRTFSNEAIKEFDLLFYPARTRAIQSSVPLPTSNSPLPPPTKQPVASFAHSTPLHPMRRLLEYTEDSMASKVLEQDDRLSHSTERLVLVLIGVMIGYVALKLQRTEIHERKQMFGRTFQCTRKLLFLLCVACVLVSSVVFLCGFYPFKPQDMQGSSPFSMPKNQSGILVSSKDSMTRNVLEHYNRFHNSTKAFPHETQRVAVNLLRSLYASKIFPMDVKTASGFHTDPRWGSARGQPIGRHYLHAWMEGLSKRVPATLMQVPSKSSYKCLEVGDGHFIRDTTARAWKQKAGAMFPWCDPTSSVSLDLVDPRSDVLANLEDPLGTVRTNDRHKLADGFDFAVAAQVFEHIDNPRAAMKGLFTLCRPGAVVLLSVPFLGNTVHGHDVHRFTTTGVKVLAEQAGFEVVENLGLGNVLTSLGYWLELSADDFTPEELNQRDPHNYVAVYATLRRPLKLKNARERRSPDQGRTPRVFGATGQRFTGVKIRSAPTIQKQHHDAVGEKLPSVNCPTNQWAVVTTINAPLPAVRHVLLSPEWCLVIVEDDKTPHAKWDGFAKQQTPVTVVLDLESQKRFFPLVAELIPLNHFGRKNIGYLYAIHQGAEYIWDFDDDNEGIPAMAPYLEMKGHVLTMEPIQLGRNTLRTTSNPYPYFGSSESRVWPRGLPLQQIHASHNRTTHREVSVPVETVGVVQYLANEEPDVDAIFRLTRTTPFYWKAMPKTHAPWLLPTKQFAPFNAQATLWSRKAFKQLMLPITVHGRVSDIWRAYIAEHQFRRQSPPLRVLFAPPTVVQHRNAHDPIRDMDAEHALYHKSDQLVTFLNETAFTSVYDLMTALYERDYLEHGDLLLWQAWDAASSLYMNEKPQ